MLMTIPPMLPDLTRAAQQAQGSLLSANQALWQHAFQQFQTQLVPWLERGVAPRILLFEANPVRFLAGFMAAVQAQCPLFLANPNWSQRDWQGVLKTAQPHLIWGTGSFSEGALTPALPQGHQGAPDTAPEQGWIMIPTGGSGGQVKFAIHTWQTLQAAVSGFQQFWGGSSFPPINACCLLPLYHVSGLMQFMRSLLTGGKLWLLSYRERVQQLQILVPPPPPDLAEADCFLSLVPTQLQCLLEQPNGAIWLQQFPMILLGGAPASAALLGRSRQLGLNLAPTYGMTETAAQVATLKPTAFLAGQTGVGQTLPHVQLWTVTEAGQRLPAGTQGRIALQTPALYLGYYPTCFAGAKPFLTDDIGSIDAAGNLHLVGRHSRKIISGGENIYPEEIEQALLQTGLVREVYVTSIPDPHWGEAIAALYVPVNATISVPQLQQKLTPLLSTYKVPKHWCPQPHLPRNAQGKLNYQALEALVQKASSND